MRNGETRVLIALDGDIPECVRGLEAASARPLRVRTVDSTADLLAALCWPGIDVAFVGERVGGRDIRRIVDDAAARGVRIPVLILRPGDGAEGRSFDGLIAGSIGVDGLSAAALAWMAHELADTAHNRDALVESDSLMRSIFESAIEAFVVLDPAARIVAFNRRAAEAATLLFGRQLRTGILLREVLPREQRVRFAPAFDAAMAGQVIDVEKPITATDGSVHWFDFRYVPVYDDDGRVEGVCLGVADVDDAHRRLDALAHREQLLRRLLAEHDAVIGIDADGRLLDLADAANRLGVAADDLHDATLADMVHPDDVAAVMGHLAAHAGSDGEVLSMDCRLRPSSAGVRWVHLRGVVSVDDGVTTFTCTIADASAERLAATADGMTGLHDPRTGLAGRELFVDRVRAAVRRRRRHPECSPAVVLVEVRGFADMLAADGPVAADRMLVEFAQRIEGAVREQDTVANLGDGRFGVLLDDLHLGSESEPVAQRVHAALSQPLRRGDRILPVHADVGVSRVVPHGGMALDGPDADRLLDTAQVALSRAGAAPEASIVVLDPVDAGQ